MFTNEEIDNEQEKVFNTLYTAMDILKGNCIEMHKEARLVAIENLKKKRKYINISIQITECDIEAFKDLLS